MALSVSCLCRSFQTGLHISLLLMATISLSSLVVKPHYTRVATIPFLPLLDCKTYPMVATGHLILAV